MTATIHSGGESYFSQNTLLPCCLDMSLTSVPPKLPNLGFAAVVKPAMQKYLFHLIGLAESFS